MLDHFGSQNYTKAGPLAHMRNGTFARSYVPSGTGIACLVCSYRKGLESDKRYENVPTLTVTAMRQEGGTHLVVG
jgi:hypothetical protein